MSIPSLQMQKRQKKKIDIFILAYNLDIVALVSFKDRIQTLTI